MKTLGPRERALYRKLLKAKLTIPGFLPVGDGLVNGLWEDVVIFDPRSWRRIAFPVIEAWTSAACERGQTIHYNLRFAGLSERQFRPDEFRGEILAFKKKMADVWAHKKPVLRTMPAPGTKKGEPARGSLMIFTGLDPLRLVRAHRVERSLYRAGLFLRHDPGETSNCLSIVLPVDELSLAALERYRPIIVDWCGKYHDAPPVKRNKFIPFPGGDSPRTLSDLQCLRLFRRMSRRRNTHSNRVFLPPKGVL